MNIDMTQVVTAADKAAAADAERLAAVKAECRRRILAVADETAQINMASAAAAGLLTAAQMTTYAAGLGWVDAMRATWPTMPANTDYLADTAWPAVPAGVAELAAAF